MEGEIRNGDKVRIKVVHLPKAEALFIPSVKEIFDPGQREVLLRRKMRFRVHSIIDSEKLEIVSLQVR